MPCQACQPGVYVYTGFSTNQKSPCALSDQDASVSNDKVARGETGTIKCITKYQQDNAIGHFFDESGDLVINGDGVRISMEEKDSMQFDVLEVEDVQEDMKYACKVTSGVYTGSEPDERELSVTVVGW